MTQYQHLIQSQLPQDYILEQNRLKQIKNKLQSQCQDIHDKITKQLHKINQTSKLINKDAQNQMRLYNQSLNSQNYSSDVIDLNKLSTYLKKQKSYLSDIASSSQQNDNKPKSGKNLLHKLSNRKKMQKYLQHLQCHKLQKQIQYLEKNILVGQTKDGRQTILYEDIQSVTLKDENQQIQKLKLLIQELERMVSLSNQCGGNINNELSNKISKLNQQAQRLYDIQQLLDKQTKEIVQVKDFFKDYEPTQINHFLNKKFDHLNNMSQANIKKNRIYNINLNHQQVDFILNFNTEVQNMKIFKKPFDQVNDFAKICKTKLKKIKT